MNEFTQWMMSFRYIWFLVWDKSKQLNSGNFIFSLLLDMFKSVSCPKALEYISPKFIVQKKSEGGAHFAWVEFYLSKGVCHLMQIPRNPNAAMLSTVWPGKIFIQCWRTLAALSTNSNISLVCTCVHEAVSVSSCQVFIQPQYLHVWDTKPRDFFVTE